MFHTIFGLAGSCTGTNEVENINRDAGLSLLGYPGLVDIDPVYCMPAEVMEKRGLRKPYRALPRMTDYPPR